MNSNQGLAVRPQNTGGPPAGNRAQMAAAPLGSPSGTEL